MPLPSIKIVAILLIGVAVVGAVAWVKRPVENKTPTTSVSVSLEADADRDGLPDWKESLWGTDVNNPDTDRDGTKDGEEVRKKRNPLVAGPNDTAIVATRTAASSSDAVRKTDLLMREVFASILALDKAQSLTEENLQSIITETINRFAIQLSPEYTTKDVKKGTETITAIRAYGNAVAKVIQKEATALANQNPDENEIALIYEIAELKNYEVLPRLIPHAARHESAAEELSRLTVPPSATALHVALMNRYARMASAFRSMALFQEDPFAIILWLNVYKKEMDGTGSLMEGFRSYFKSRGVEFKEGETGFLFTDNS